MWSSPRHRRSPDASGRLAARISVNLQPYAVLRHANTRTAASTPAACQDCSFEGLLHFKTVRKQTTQTLARACDNCGASWRCVSATPRRKQTL